MKKSRYYLYFSIMLVLFFVCASSAKYQSLDLGLQKIPAKYIAIESADIDFDGDMDIFIGTWDGFISYYKNIGNPESFQYKLISAGSRCENSYSYIYTLNKSIPRFIDIDNDNDLDLFIGNNTGNIAFYRNDGNFSHPEFIKIKSGDTKQNSFFNINVSMASAPFFIDIDNDDDYDLFIGNAFGNIAFYKNKGNPESPQYVCINSGKTKENSFQQIQSDLYTVPVFTDIDNDEKPDLFLGDINGRIIYYKNIGSKEKIKFKHITDNFQNINTKGDSAPCFADLNNDGIYELIIGNNNGDIFCFTSTNPRLDKKIIAKKKIAVTNHEPNYDKIKYFLQKKDYIEALNLINSLPEKTKKSRYLRKIAKKNLKKILQQNHNSSLLFKEIASDFKEAVNQYIKGEYKRSLKLFNKVLYILPNHKLSLTYKSRAKQKLQYKENENQAKQYYKKAVSSYKSNDLTGAYNAIKQAKILNPENKKYCQTYTKYSNDYNKAANNEFYKKNLQKVKKLISNKKYKEAYRILLKLKVKFPEDTEISGLIKKCHKNSIALRKTYNNKMKEEYLKKGDDFFNKNDFKNALTQYKKALKYDPKDSNLIEKIQQSKNKIEKKEKRILDPKAVKKHFQEGMKFYSIGQYKKAIFEWEKVLELDPQHVMAKKNIEKARSMVKQ